MHNRHNSGQDRLAKYQVWVGSSSEWNSTGWSASSRLCSESTAPTTAGPFYEVCDTAGGPLRGKFVTVLLPGSDRILNLAEVKVRVSQRTTTSTSALHSQECDEASWPALFEQYFYTTSGTLENNDDWPTDGSFKGAVCGRCKVLANYIHTHGSCHAYCASLSP